MRVIISVAILGVIAGYGSGSSVPPSPSVGAGPPPPPSPVPPESGINATFVDGYVEDGAVKVHGARILGAVSEVFSAAFSASFEEHESIAATFTECNPSDECSAPRSFAKKLSAKPISSPATATRVRRACCIAFRFNLAGFI